MESNSAYIKKNVVWPSCEVKRPQKEIINLMLHHIDNLFSWLETKKHIFFLCCFGILMSHGTLYYIRIELLENQARKQWLIAIDRYVRYVLQELTYFEFSMFFCTILLISILYWRAGIVVVLLLGNLAGLMHILLDQHISLIFILLNIGLYSYVLYLVFTKLRGKGIKARR